MIIITAVLLTLVISVFGIFLYKKFNYITDDVIANEVSLGDNWKSIPVDPPIRIERDVNKLNLDPAPPFSHPIDEKVIVAPDGEKFLPEVEIVTAQDDIVELQYSGGRFTGDHQFLSFGRLSDFSPGMVIKEIRLRSRHDVTLRTVWWSSYNAKDMP